MPRSRSARASAARTGRGRRRRTRRTGTAAATTHPCRRCSGRRRRRRPACSPGTAGSATAVRTVAHREHRDLGAGEALLDHDAPAGIAERRARQLVPHVLLGLGQRLGDEHPLAGGQPVGLHDVQPREGAQEGERRLDLRERLVPGGGHAGGGHEVLHELLGPLELGAVGTGAEHPRRPSPAAGRRARPPAAAPDRRRRGRRRARRAACDVDPSMPGLPGVTTTSAVRPSTIASACSRPPPPTTTTFTRASCARSPHRTSSPSGRHDSAVGSTSVRFSRRGGRTGRGPDRCRRG